jgi:hypothetical protein
MPGVLMRSKCMEHHGDLGAVHAVGPSRMFA